MKIFSKNIKITTSDQFHVKFQCVRYTSRLDIVYPLRTHFSENLGCIVYPLRTHFSGNPGCIDKT